MCVCFFIYACHAMCTSVYGLLQETYQSSITLEICTRLIGACKNYVFILDKIYTVLPIYFGVFICIMIFH